ncbi:hypothetical protein VNO80_06071 [Phaseolus coccineus]|uniref:Uncharacterized protein n=1 Tax=Phaseolus coccineus TaxID=3886 RepID=A0AAN9NLF4_PHACN
MHLYFTCHLFLGYYYEPRTIGCNLCFYIMRHSLRRRKSKSKPKFVVKAQAKSKSLRQMLTSCGGNCCF